MVDVVLVPTAPTTIVEVSDTVVSVDTTEQVVTLTSVNEQGPAGPPGPMGSNTNTESLLNTSGSTMVIGQIVYTNGNGTVGLAQANADGTRRPTGFVTDVSVLNNASATIAIDGTMSATTGQWDTVTGGSGGLAPNAFYYLSTTVAGSITSTLPTTGWQVRVGKAISTTHLQLMLDTLPIRLT